MSLELPGAGSGYICSVGTSESWVKGIPDPAASVLPSPASKKKENKNPNTSRHPQKQWEQGCQRGSCKNIKVRKTQGRSPGDAFQPHRWMPWEYHHKAGRVLGKSVLTALHSVEAAFSGLTPTACTNPSTIQPVSAPNLYEGPTSTSPLTEHQT